MRKSIFLEYKFGDYNQARLYNSGANEVVAWMEKLNKSRLDQLHKWGVDIYLSFDAFVDDTCPLSPKSYSRLVNLTQKALKLHPKGIVFDHFRFRGKWEEQKNPTGAIVYQYIDSHKPCRYCADRDKTQAISNLALQVKKIIPTSILTGYYAVPFESKEAPSFGQDHRALGQVFDYACPMLYHRMIRKPVSYISKFTYKLSALTQKPILPTIQVKDMPDNLPDKITRHVLEKEFIEAFKKPSTGVCWFSWDAAIEKNKCEIISNLLSLV